MSRKVRIRLTGGDAELGRVAASDVAELLLGFERAMARASGHVVGKALKRRGRWTKDVEQAVRLKLVNIESGSVVAVVEVPELPIPVGSLNLRVETLGELALDRTLKVAAGRSRDADVASALATWAESVGVGTRHDAIELVERRPGARKITIDQERKDRLLKVAMSAPARKADRVTGVLYEADFELHKAHVRTPTTRVVADFDESLAPDIKEALRERADLVGDVEFDPQTNVVTSVHVRQIERGEQIPIGLDPGEFRDNPSIQQLARRKGLPVVTDPMVLRDVEATDDEADAMLAALAD